MNGASTDGVACAYCGGRHPSAADVRVCWAGQAAPLEEPTAPPAAPPTAQSVPGPRPATSGSWAGPDALGRNLVVIGNAAAPEPWARCEVIVLEGPRGGAPDDWPPDRLVDRMVAAAHARQRLVFRAGEAPVAAVGAPVEVERREPWRLDPRTFRFARDLLAHLATANSAELSPDGLRFPLAERAVALGAGPGDGESRDVVLAGGQPAFCDGGPPRALRGEDMGRPEAVVVHRVAIEHGSLEPFGPASRSAHASGLAPDQRRAVEHPGGAARIIAPAGSGKTRVLTERARHLLTAWKVPAGAVCLVAYNVRAAEEMRARTTDLAGLEVRTLNSLALAVVNGSPPFARRPGPRRATIDETEVRDLLRTLVDLPRRANTDPAAAWIEALSTVRLGLRDPDDVAEEYAGDVDGLADVFPRYRGLLAERALLDFDEQVYRAVEVLLAEPGARHAAQRACRLLLVDEFQDLTPAHVLLLRLVAGPDGAVFGVGDDDQTIYGYAGASPGWLIGFAGLFPGAAELALEVNYRCPPTVVAAADRLLRRNHRRVPKRIVPAGGREARPGELQVLTAGGEAVDRTVGRVDDLLAAEGAPADVAVLARVNAALVPVQVALGERGVPTRSLLDDGWMRRTAVASALAWLRIAAVPRRIAPEDLRLALRRPPRGIAPKIVDWAADQRSVEGLTALAKRLVGRDGPKVAGLAADIAALSEAVRAGGTAAAALAIVRDDLGLDRAMVSLEGARRRLDRSAQTDDLDALVALARIHPEVATFEDWLRSLLRQPSQPHGVTLATVHSVKGREWPHVVVHEATAGVFPHRLATDLAEERRVFHVALTRGRDTVAISVGDRPSPFVAELFREPGDDPVPAVPPPVALRPTPARPATARPGPEVERAKALLREWRRGLAVAEKRPAYTVLHDRTLDAVAEAMPTSLSDLRAIAGIGPAKLDRYGDIVLALVAEAAEGQ